MALRFSPDRQSSAMLLPTNALPDGSSGPPPRLSAIVDERMDEEGPWASSDAGVARPRGTGATDAAR
jgi:hypothetical protein